MGLRSVAAVQGFHWKLALFTDFAAAAGICRRRGLGKIRRLAAADLCVHDRIRTGDFTLQKVLGTEHVADLHTKHIDRATFSTHGCPWSSPH